MKWQLDNDRPIYVQLIEQIKMFIISGEFESGSKVPPVRELATQSGVNPNTMQRALAELEREGLMYTNRTSGRFVTEDAELIESAKAELAESIIKSFVCDMKNLGYSAKQTAGLLNDYMEGSENE